MKAFVGTAGIVWFVSFVIPSLVSLTSAMPAAAKELDDFVRCSRRLVDENNESTSTDPFGRVCQACQGDCDTDEDCDNGLRCFHRNNGEPVPGCTGHRNVFSRSDFCIPQEQLVVRIDPPCSAYAPCHECQGHCRSDRDCAPNMRCTVRASNDDAVDGCFGQDDPTVQGNSNNRPINFCVLTEPVVTFWDDVADQAVMIGAIAGGVVGFLCCFCVFVCWCRRRETPWQCNVCPKREQYDAPANDTDAKPPGDNPDVHDTTGPQKQETPDETNVQIVQANVYLISSQQTPATQPSASFMDGSSGSSNSYQNDGDYKGGKTNDTFEHIVDTQMDSTDNVDHGLSTDNNNNTDGSTINGIHAGSFHNSNIENPYDGDSVASTISSTQHTMRTETQPHGRTATGTLDTATIQEEDGASKGDQNEDHQNEDEEIMELN